MDIQQIWYYGSSCSVIHRVVERITPESIRHCTSLTGHYSTREMNETKITVNENLVTSLSCSWSVPVRSNTFLILFRWCMCRVFISSTFLDMHAERNLLTRFVFPELRARAEHLFVNIRDVDLRWGVSQHDAQSHRY